MRLVIVTLEGEERPGIVRPGETYNGKCLVIFTGTYDPGAAWVHESKVRFVSRRSMDAWYRKNVGDIE